MPRNDSVTVSVEFLYHKGLAILVADGDSEIWIPISQIEEREEWDTMERHAAIEITIPEWLAEEKGLI